MDSSKDHGRTFPDSSDGSGVEAPERISLGVRARDAVRQRIVDGRYPQGARLVEREVAEELRMSRVPVREALRALVTEGLLELLPHSGVRVRRLERDDVEHLYEVWEPLAVQASRLAARRVARAVPGELSPLAPLRASLERAERAAGDGDGAREVAAHTAFHEDIVTLTGNPLLARTMEQLSWQLQLLFGMRREPAHMRAQHEVMFRHIAQGDEEAAAASTLLHVRDSRAVAMRALFEAT
ncbi:GntR family transcriptional regulator [Streptomyces sp. NPDC005146]|uniref:GntR family transcriptional regulator n=1 Tax=Streptomyces sp. NPDC057291 TaxID=3346087 RepID=UPI00364292D4